MGMVSPSRSSRYPHPYRSPPADATKAAADEVIEPSEELVVLAVIALVGALGILIGVLAPDRTVEPTLGMLMLVLAVRTYWVEPARRRERARR